MQSNRCKLSAFTLSTAMVFGATAMAADCRRNRRLSGEGGDVL